MRKRRSEFELFFLLTLVALAAAWYARTHLRGEQPLPNLSWEEHFHRAELAIAQGELGQAERELLRARGLARDFEAGDDRLARTLDKLGKVYFNAEDYSQAKACQSDAVAALLLARGPHDERIEGWVKSYLWSKSRTEEGISYNKRDPLEQPHSFVLNYRPITVEGRHRAEWQNLVAAYKFSQDQRPYEALSSREPL